jgi:DNA-binding PadR family transcriptional regulator
VNAAHRAAVLEALAQGAAFGLELHERIQSAKGPSLHEIYPLLRDLEREGTVESWEESTPETVGVRGGRPRRYYRLVQKAERSELAGDV